MIYDALLCLVDQGVPGLSTGSSLTVRILPSDDAFGVFSFAADSLTRLVAERDGGTTVTLTVERQGGTFADVSVYWEVEGEGNGDISPTSGQVDFAEGVTRGELTVTVTNDQVYLMPTCTCIHTYYSTALCAILTLFVHCIIRLSLF